MKRYFGPYLIDSSLYIRQQMDDDIECMVWLNILLKKWTHNFVDPNDKIWFDTLELAQKSIDTILVAQGHEILTQEQFDKLKILI